MTGRRKFLFLTDRAEADIKNPVADIINRGCIDMAAAFRAERLDAGHATIRRLDIILGRLIGEGKLCFLGGHDDAIDPGR